MCQQFYLLSYNCIHVYDTYMYTYFIDIIIGYMNSTFLHLLAFFDRRCLWAVPKFCSGLPPMPVAAFTTGTHVHLCVLPYCVIYMYMYSVYIYFIALVLFFSVEMSIISTSVDQSLNYYVRKRAVKMSFI